MAMNQCIPFWIPLIKCCYLWGVVVVVYLTESGISQMWRNYGQACAALDWLG